MFIDRIAPMFSAEAKEKRFGVQRERQHALPRAHVLFLLTRVLDSRRHARITKRPEPRRENTLHPLHKDG